MGQLQGKATYLDASTSFLNASERDVNKLWEGFNDVAEGFGLNRDEFVEICQLMQRSLDIYAHDEMDQLSGALFTALDTDENGLVDALEFLGTMAMISAMSTSQKLTFVYNCYDFNETGQLSLDELTLAFKSTLTGLCKLCQDVSCPTEHVLENLARYALQKAHKADEDAFLSLSEFLNFCNSTPEVTSWVDYFDCPGEKVDEQTGDDSDVEQETIANILASSAFDDGDKARDRDRNLPYDASVLDFTVNKVLEQRPWQLAVTNLAHSPPPVIDPRLPAASLELEWIYGFNSDLRNIVKYVSTTEAIYTAGSVVVLYDTDAHHQQFACHHSGLVQSMALHPLNRRVVATGECALEPKIVVWSTESVSESGGGGGIAVLSVIRGFHRQGVSQLAWLPTGRTLVTVGQDEFHCIAVYQWGKATGTADSEKMGDADWEKPATLVFAGRGGQEPVHALAVFSGPTGQPQFVTAGQRHLFFWIREPDVQYSNSHALYKRLPGVLGRKAKVQTILSLAVIPGASVMIAGTARGQLLVFEGRNCVRVIHAHAAAVTALYALSDGLLSGGNDGKIRVWNRRIEAGAQFDLVALGSSAPRVRSLVASPDGEAKKLLIATAGAEIFEIASSDGANLHFGPVVCGHSTNQLHGLATHPHRHECCSVGDDHTVRVWDLSMHRQIRVAALDAPARACAYSPDGSMIAVGQGVDEDDERIAILPPKLRSLQERQQSKFVNSNKTGAFVVLKESSLAVKFEAKDSKRAIKTVRFSGDGLTLAIGSSDNCIYSYHTEDWASKGKCRARDAGAVLSSFDFSTTGEHILANARNRGEIIAFESSSGGEITQLATLRNVEWLTCSCPYGWGVQGAWPAHGAQEYEISAVDRSSGAETQLLVTGDTLGILRLFRYPCVNLDSHSQFAYGAASTISAIRFTANGSYVVACARDERCIFQWRVEREEVDAVGTIGDANDPIITSDDEREQSHGKLRSIHEEVAAVGDFALELIENRLQNSMCSNDDKRQESELETSKAHSLILKPWVKYSVPPSQSPSETNLELPTLPSESLELEWVYGYRCHDVRNNAFLTQFSSSIVYPAANLVVVMDTKLWLQRHFKQHTDEVTSLTMHIKPGERANNFREIAASGQMGRLPVIHIWRVDSFEVIMSLRGFHRQGIAELRFNAGGNLLASIGLDDRNSLALYDWRSGELLAHTSTSSVGRILGLSFQQESVMTPKNVMNSNGSKMAPIIIATVGVKSAAFWRLGAGRTLIKKDALLGRKGHQLGVTPSFLSIVYMGDDAIAGTVSGDLISFRGIELFSIVPAHTRSVAALYAVASGIVSGGQDGLVKLWSADLECLAEFGKFNPAQYAIRSVFWDTARELLLVGTRGASIHLISSRDGTPIEFQMPDGASVPFIETHSRGELHGLCVCQTKARGCTTGDDAVLRVWDLTRHLEIMTKKLETFSRACAYSPDGNFIAVGLGSDGTSRRHKKDGTLLVFEDRGQSLEIVHETRDTKQAITVMHFSPDGHSLVCGAFDGSVYIYDVPTNFMKRAIFSKHKAPITHLDISSNSQYVRSNCKGFELFFADVTTGSHIASATALRDQTWDTCSTIYNWSNQGIWPVPHRDLNDAIGEITCCACSEPSAPYVDSSAVLAAGNSHGAIKLFNYPAIAQGAGAKTYHGHSGAVSQLCFLRAGGSVCVSIGRYDRCMLQWRRVDSADRRVDNEQSGNVTIAKDPEGDPDVDAEGHSLLKAITTGGRRTHREAKPFLQTMIKPSNAVQEPSRTDGVGSHRSFELEHVFGMRAHDARQNVMYARPKRIVYPTGYVGVSYDRREHRQVFYDGHKHPIFCLTTSSCGGFVASGEICTQDFAQERPRIHIWEPATCMRIVELSSFHSKAVTAVCFSSIDPKLLAAVGQDDFHSIAVYRSPSGQWYDGALFASSRTTKLAVFFVCFIEEPHSAEGCHLVSGGEDHVIFWKMTPLTLTARNGTFGARAQRQPVLCGAAMDDILITGCESGHLYVWQACAVSRVIPAHAGSVYAIHATPLGCATGGRDGHVKLWARKTLTPLIDFDIAQCQPAPHNACVRSICWDVAEDRLLIGTISAELLELSCLTRNTILVSEGHFDRTLHLNGLAVHPLQPELVATAGGDSTVRLWHLEKRCVIAKTVLDGALHSVAFSPEGKWLAVGFGGTSPNNASHKDGAFAILNSQTLEVLHEGRDSKSSAMDMTFSPDLTLLALASADHCVYFYSTLENFALRFKFSKSTGCATRLDFAVDSSMARVSTDAFELLFVSTMDGGHITSAASVADVTWASHKCLFSWDSQGVWDFNGKPEHHVYALAKANTQEMLVAATNQGKIHVYDMPCLSRHTEQDTLRGHSLDVANVAFTCDDSRLVSVDLVGYLRLTAECDGPKLCFIHILYYENTRSRMGRVFEMYVDSSRIFCCGNCNAHLARNEDIISKNFQGTSGKAYLFDTAVNVCTGPPEERMLMTGLHVVLDLYCNTCWSPVGWKYREAHNASEKYKEGKFILELAKTNQSP
ncbi:putative EH domain, EF-hand domain pair, WD40/YVTN repeat-like-containing domain superfamily [Plasmopara halstedii]